MTHSVWRNVALATVIIGIAILLGRLLGFARTSAVASQFGVSPEADAVILLLAVPDLLSSILIGTAASAVLVPEFQAAERRGPAELSSIFVQATVLALLSFALLAALAGAAPQALLRVLTPGLGESVQPEAASLFRLVAWAFPIVAATAVSSAYLQSRGRFAVASLGTVFFNSTTIMILLWAARPGEIGALGWGIILAALFRWGSQLIHAVGLGIRPATVRGSWLLGRGLPAQYAMALGTSCAVAVAPVATRSLASLTGPGGFATMDYAIRLLELPLGTVVTALGIALYPQLSQAFGRKDGQLGEMLLRRGLWGTWAIAIPVSIVVGSLARQWADLLFGRGAISAQAVQEVGGLVAVGAWALPAQGIIWLALWALYALKAGRTALVVIAVWIIAYVVVGRWLTPEYGLGGLMATSVVFYWGLSVALVWVLGYRSGLAPINGDLARDAGGVVATGVVGGVLPLFLLPVPTGLATTVLTAGIVGLCSALAIVFWPCRTVPGIPQLILHRLLWRRQPHGSTVERS